MKKDKQIFLRTLIRFFSVTIIVSLILIACSKKDDGFPGTEDPDPPITEEPNNQCPSGYLFSRAPVNLEDLTSMGVLGSLIPPGHTFPTPHSYMYVMDQNTSIDKPANIYASTNMTLKTIVLKYYEVMGDKTNYTDYDLHFSICDSVDMYFIHVRELTHPLLIQALNNGDCPSEGSGRSYQECHMSVDIDINVDEIIGTTGDLEAKVFGLDVGLRDYRLKEGRSAYANPDRWCNTTTPFIYQRCYTACFFDYLSPNIANNYLDLFRMGSEDQIQRTASPVCGTTYLDILNTAQGYWFPTESGAVMSETNSLFLGPNDYLPQYGSISTGNGIPNLNSWVYSFAIEETGLYNRSFGDLNDTQIYAYTNLYNSLSSLHQGYNHYVNFSIIMQLSEDGLSLKVEKQDQLPNDPSEWSFTSNAVTFYR